MRMGIRDPRSDEGPRRDGPDRMDELVGPGSALQISLASRPLDEDLHSRTQQLPVALQGDALLEGDQSVEPLLHNRFGHLLLECRRGRAGARRILEREGGIEAGSRGYGERLREVLFRLSWETHDDVTRHRDPRDAPADPFEPAEVALRTVRPAHRPKDPIRPGLEREVDMLAHPLSVRHRLDDVFGEVVTVTADESDAADLLHVVHGPKEFREPRARRRARNGQIAAVGVDVLAEE